MELGIYVHIPFCVKKCYYCDFVSYPNKFQMQDIYVKKLIEEIKDNRQLLEDNEITTIYIGGGTPSSINENCIVDILEEIYSVARINNEDKKGIEITIEVNPGTVTKQKLQTYRNAGINRISIGLQSTNDRILKQIGRIHNYKQFLDTYNFAKEAGFENINVDLMLGLPNQSIRDLKHSLENVVKLEPKHISVYSLIVEEGTQIEKMIDNGQINLPQEDEERNEYKYTKNYLELNGYKHYEISNFAKQGCESKHNMNCWEQKQYIGIGIAAHSYVNGTRYSNTDDIEQYISNYSTHIKKIHETQNKSDMEKEYMLLGLRKIDGVQISRFKEKFGENPIYLYRKELERLVNEELVIVDLNNIKLTYKGLDFANLVWEEFV